MVQIETSVDFEAAHRQYGDPNKCGYLHGHNWRADFLIEGEVDNNLGYLINFSDLKDMVRQYDHKVLMLDSDPLAASLEQLGQRVYRLPLNPTCENLASIILRNLWETVGLNVTYIKVTVWENHESNASDFWVRKNDAQ